MTMTMVAPQARMKPNAFCVTLSIFRGCWMGRGDVYGYKLTMYQAGEAGLTRHSDREFRKFVDGTGTKVLRAEGLSRRDCWFFVVDRKIENLPDWLSVLSPDQTEGLMNGFGGITVYDMDR